MTYTRKTGLVASEIKKNKLLLEVSVKQHVHEHWVLPRMLKIIHIMHNVRSFPKLPGPVKGPCTIRVSGERVTRSQMHPVPSCHICVPLGEQHQRYRAHKKPQRLKREGCVLCHRKK